MKGKISGNQALFMLSGESILVDNFLFTRWVKHDIPDMPRKPVDDFPLEYPPDQQVLRASKKLGLFNAFRLACHPVPERINACQPGKYYFIVDLFRASLDYQRPGVRKRYPDFDAFIPDYYDSIFRILKAYPETSWGVVCGEMDSCCVWPQKYFSGKKEAYRFWKKTFFHQGVGSNRPASLFAYLKDRGIDYRQANLMVQGAMLFAVHHYYHWGFRFVWLERGCGLSNLQLGVAFLRGAARQYQGFWGLDFSTHHPHRNQPTWYDHQGRRRGGWSESLMLRSWLTGFLSGAHLVHEETSNYTHWVYKSSGQFKLSLAGQYAKKLADFALRKHPERGQTVTPVALLVNFYHGFDARHSIHLQQPFVWGNRVPVTAEDWQLSNLLEFFFPGQAQAWGMFDEAFNPAVPWKTQWEYLKMLQDGMDMRPYEVGHLVNSRFGDCLDVLVDTVTLKTLTNYQIVFLGGQLNFSPRLLATLTKYLKNGGLVVAAVNQLPEDFLRSLGVRRAGRKWEYDLTFCQECGKAFGGDRYQYDLLFVPGAKILGENHLGHPLAFQIPVGKGTLVLTAVVFSQDIAARRILPLFAHIFQKYITPVLPVTTHPRPLQTIFNQASSFLLLGAINNSAHRWKGSFRIQEGKGRQVTQIMDIWNEKIISSGKTTVPFCFNDEIEAFGFKVYQLSLTKEEK
ncbi:MAG: hypothetical protein NC911_08465 [Candidatus Omnitrophica bacterium]|nr:hypothetical protein [Candidatus Omnitrophota bacterium]